MFVYIYIYIYTSLAITNSNLFFVSANYTFCSVKCAAGQTLIVLWGRQSSTYDLLWSVCRHLNTASLVNLSQGFSSFICAIT